jgi:hypothetical protein
VETAKRVLTANEAVLYGIFGQISAFPYFPPRPFLNEFLMGGSDPCDQDRRMGTWTPFALSSEEYREVKEWWAQSHPGSVENALGARCWNDWAQVILGLWESDDAPADGFNT